MGVDKRPIKSGFGKWHMERHCEEHRKGAFRWGSQGGVLEPPNMGGT